MKLNQATATTIETGRVESLPRLEEGMQTAKAGADEPRRNSMGGPLCALYINNQGGVPSGKHQKLKSDLSFKNNCIIVVLLKTHTLLRTNFAAGTIWLANFFFI